MRRLLLPCLLVIATVSIVIGSTYPRDRTPGETNDAGEADQGPAAPQLDTGVVFRARYYHTMGPCIRKGDSFELLAVDAFEVIEVTQGELKAKHISVRPFTAGAGYPRELSRENVYTLRLTPTASTLQRLQENEQSGGSSIEVDAKEIEEVKVGNSGR